MHVINRMSRPHPNEPRSVEKVDLRRRTKTLSLHAIKTYQLLPTTDESRILGRSMLRHVTRVGALYRAAIRSRHLRSFIKRLDAALYDLDIAGYWLDLLIDSGVPSKGQLPVLLIEVHELMAIMVSCRKAAKKASYKKSLLNREMTQE